MESYVLPATASGPDDQWHQVGNAALTATAHRDGRIELYATARSMVRLSGRRSRWGLAGAAPGALDTTWLPGGARWQGSLTGRGADAPIRFTRTVTAPFDDLPGLRIDVEVTGLPAPTQWEERWVPEVYPLLVGGLMSRWCPPPPGTAPGDALVWSALYATSALSRRLTDAVRRRLAATMRPGLRPLPSLGGVTWVPRHAVAPRRIDPPPMSGRPAWFDRTLPHVVVASLDHDRADEVQPDGSGTVRRRIVPDDSGTWRGSFAVALDDSPWRLDGHLARLRALEPEAERDRWASTIRLDGLRSDAATEMPWHGAYLLGARQRDDLLGTYVAQGSAYSFIHGLQGAPRDYAIFSVPLTLLDPAAAREQLRVILRMTTRRGIVQYAHTGRGMTTSGGIHAAPTDLPLFVLWAVTEWILTTGDRSLLDEQVAFWPPHPRGTTSTVRDRLLLAWQRLRDDIGTGPNGLVRVGSGDWADPISAMVADRRAFHAHGESGFNTGFAAYTLPRAAWLLDDTHPADAEAMRCFARATADALADTWNGRWFLRGFDGRGGGVGDTHLFVDGQVWALIAGIGTGEQRRRLVDEIWERCVEPSPIGATILDRPHPVRFGMLAPGWDCNGGVWAAINALLAWGVSLHDGDRGWRLVERQSLAAHARAYPEVWFGRWSGPDAYNAWFGSRPGETFVQPATPMQEWPVMNANAHAGPLLAAMRALGVEADRDGLCVRPRPGGPTGWTLHTGLGVLQG